MSQRTVLNDSYKGLVENMAIPADVLERDGKKFASIAGVLPIHSCTEEQVASRSATTHHYCDIFTDSLLAPLEELAFVRLDENTAEKVFINRSKRILITSSDGRLAQWRAAPTFESSNHYIAGAPIVNKEGALISVVTARRGNHYAVSSFEGDGGYFETTLPWRVVDVPPGHLVYGASVFPTRTALLAHLAHPSLVATPEGTAPPAPVLARAAPPRLVLLAGSGRQLAHFYLQGVLADGVDYL